MSVSDAELEALIARDETSRLELKRQWRNAKDDVCEDICAYSNDLGASGQPGFVIIGMGSDGTCAELPIDEALLRDIAQIRLNGNIVPFPDMTVERRRLAGCEVAVIEVGPHRYPPVRYEGRVWVRTGPVRHKASPAEEIRLAERRRGGDLPFVLRPAEGTDLSDLDLTYCEEAFVPRAISPDVLAANDRSLHQRLASLRLLTADAAMPTYGGLLLAGFDPAVHVPGARIEFRRFEGTDRAGVIRAQHEPAGGLLRVFEQVEELLPLYIEVRSAPGEGLRRMDSPSYPAWALREYVFNALTHRNYEGTAAPVRVDWYDDRVEVLSPGGLFGHVTKDNFRRVNDYRNELLAGAARTMGWVEKAGSGIVRAEKLLAENGNPPPDYAFEPEYVLVTIGRPSE